MRLIDADELKLRMDTLEMFGGLKGLMEFARRMVIVSPTVDAEPVVRCKDCKYADEYARCKWVKWYNNKDDFCSRGERKEDAPTVDPIKHGHWISCDDDGDSPYKCSVCGGVKVNESGEWLDICHQEWSKMPFCAVCGAKMDERET